MKQVNPLVIIYTLALLGSVFHAHALTTDKDQPIQIEADRLDIDDKRHLSTYQGNVEMRQGSLTIRAERIVFHFNDKNDLLHLEISGTPAEFNQLNDEQQVVSGSANTILYYENESLLKLQGNARFQSNEDIIESELISVNTDTNALKAGDSESKQRVRMLIQPQSSPPAE